VHENDSILIRTDPLTNDHLLLVLLQHSTVVYMTSRKETVHSCRAAAAINGVKYVGLTTGEGRID
jgi:hypothetical protein